LTALRVGCIASVVVALLPPSARAVEAPCADGWLAVHADLVRAMPASAPVLRIEASGKQTEIFDGQTLCEGDTVVLEPPLQYVEMRQGGRITKVSVGEHRWTVPQGLKVATAAVGEYIRLTMDALTVFSPPASRPRATSVRGSEPETQAPARAVRFLDSGEPAHVTADRPVIVAWRNGTPPFACVADSWRQVSPETGTARWCEFPVPPPHHQLTSIGMAGGEGGPGVHWKIDQHAWRDVPRPDWIVHENGPPASATDEMAWALWLWQHAPAEWRLQSLAMLDDAARTEWLAGSILDSILNENSPMLPN
jgi:hypothetical protein